MSNFFGFNLRCPFHAFVAGAAVTGLATYALTRLVNHSVKRIDPKLRYSEAVVFDQLVFLSGQVSSGQGDIAEQTVEGENKARSCAKKEPSHHTKSYLLSCTHQQTSRM